MTGTAHPAGAAIEALRRGDARGARAQLDELVAAGHADATTLLALSHACLVTGDAPARAAALDRLLAQEPRHLRALVLRGDCHAEAGDERSAGAFYLQALRLAPPPAQRPPEMAADLARIERACAAYAKRYEDWLESRLAAAGFDRASASPRFAQSLDIALGRRRIYVQEPKFFYFAELPQVQFYPRAQFPWLDAVEQATAEIRDELMGVLDEPGAFAPYVQGDPRRPRKGQMGMLDNPDWSAFYLVRSGERQEANIARCPRTFAALAGAPLCDVPGRSPSVLFSLLRPRTHIPPHTGFVNTRLICHLPLVVPAGCRFRVGNEVREWVEGKAWVFDDSFDHEAWNDSDRTRVILLFDVWRPELSAEERRLVRELFAAIDAYGGPRVEWDT